MEASPIIQLITGVSLDANKILHTQSIALVESYAIEVVVTGSPVGQFILEGSITGDADKYFSVEAPLPLTGSAINKAYAWKNYPFRFLQLRYIFTSGSGAITVTSHAKNTT